MPRNTRIPHHTYDEVETRSNKILSWDVHTKIEKGIFLETRCVCFQCLLYFSWVCPPAHKKCIDRRKRSHFFPSIPFTFVIVVASASILPEAFFCENVYNWGIKVYLVIRSIFLSKTFFSRSLSCFHFSWKIPKKGRKEEDKIADNFWCNKCAQNE